MKIFGLELSKKVIIGIVVGVVAVGGVTTGAILLNGNDDNSKQEVDPNNLILNNDLEFEINSELTLLNLVSQDNKVEIVSPDEAIDTSNLGDKEITIKYLVDNNEKEKTFTIKIVDTEAPTIEYTKELSTNVGTKIDLLKNVKASDNSKEEIQVTVEGEYDFNQEGTYKLKYVAKDSSNNQAEEEFTFKVNKNACDQKSGSWSTTKPSTSCGYTTKKLVWRWQVVDYDSQTDTNIYGWTIDVNFHGVVGSAEPEDLDSSYDVYPYLSTKPKETYNDNQDHEKVITVYIIK